MLKSRIICTIIFTYNGKFQHYKKSKPWPFRDHQSRDKIACILKVEYFRSLGNVLLPFDVTPDSAKSKVAPWHSGTQLKERQ